MADEENVKVRVSRNIPVIPADPDGNPIPTVVAYYEAGFEGHVPRSHVDQIVKAGAGEVVEEDQRKK